jgi:hypothetical protein
MKLLLAASILLTASLGGCMAPDWDRLAHPNKDYDINHKWSGWGLQSDLTVKSQVSSNYIPTNAFRIAPLPPIGQ